MAVCLCGCGDVPHRYKSLFQYGSWNHTCIFLYESSISLCRYESNKSDMTLKDPASFTCYSTLLSFEGLCISQFQALASPQAKFQNCQILDPGQSFWSNPGGGPGFPGTLYSNKFYTFSPFLKTTHSISRNSKGQHRFINEKYVKILNTKFNVH